MLLQGDKYAETSIAALGSSTLPALPSVIETPTAASGPGIAKRVVEFAITGSLRMGNERKSARKVVRAVEELCAV